MFRAECHEGNIPDLRSYDLRHTFATRLLERGVYHYVISALMGRSASVAGFGSRMTPGYAHVSWEAMVKAVYSLEELVPTVQSLSDLYSGELPANVLLAQKAG